MNKIKGLILICCAVFLGTSLSFGQGHLLITEFANTPTAGEFIEIYNPTSDSVDLTNYYLTDAISGNDNDYIHVVEGGFVIGSGADFMSKFPDGVKIGPGQYICVAFKGDDFLATYGVSANFEIRGVDAAT